MSAYTIPRDGEHDVGNDPARQYVAKRILAFSGGDVNTGAVQGTYPLFNVPVGCIVDRVKARVKTAWTASVTITIGDGDSAAGYLSSADIAPATAVATGVMKDSEALGEAYATGRHYLAADSIDAVVAGANPAAGELEVYVYYHRAGQNP